MLTRRERFIVLIIAAVQFINILDFIMVTPLAGDFATALGIRTNRIGLVAGSYTVAAGVSGLIGSTFWDRFERKRALACCVTGLAVGTLACALAVDIWTLIAARVFAGVFGGPATALAIAIVADTVPDERRGRAMGVVMGAFSMASILGVPAGLKLAELGTWRTPFIVVGIAACVVTVAALLALPSMREHIGQGTEEQRRNPLRFLRKSESWYAYGMIAAAQTAGFMIFPNITAYVLFNLGHPRSELEVLYFVGGILSLFGMQVAGRLSDRIGVFRVGTAAIVAACVITYLLFVAFEPGWPLLPLFAGFMLTMSMRAVAQNTIASQVPAAHERARFMSFQSAVQHFASSTGAIVSSLILVEGAGKVLVGFDTVVIVSIALFMTLPPFMWVLEGRIRGRTRVATPEPAPHRA